MVEFVVECDGVLTATDTDSGITLVSLLFCRVAFVKEGMDARVEDVRRAVFVDVASGMLPKIKGGFLDMVVSFLVT